MSQIVRIDWQHILSRVRISVRPRHFYMQKTPTTIANTALHTLLFIWMKQLPAIQRRRKGGVYLVMGGRTDPSNSDNQKGDGGGLVWACVCACMCACMRDVFAIYDNNILPRLVMIITKIICYIIFHRNCIHWWFPLNGYPASHNNSLYLCIAIYQK